MVKKIKRKKPVRKWVKHLKRYFSKEETQTANRYIKKRQFNITTVKEMQIQNHSMILSNNCWDGEYQRAKDTKY